VLAEVQEWMVTKRSTMVSATNAALAAAGWLVLAASAWAGENRAVDASFESPLPSWFAEHAGTSYYAGKEEVAGAAEGRMVLAVEGWDRKGSKILSGPIRLAAGDPAADKAAPLVGATAAVRSFGKTEGATFELALFDEKGAKRLASFGRVPLDGKGTWQTVSQAGVKVDPATRTCRLALVVAGPQDQARVEVDCVGLFCGAALGPVADNSDLVVQEAEDLADGTVWEAVDHYPNWYRGRPSREKMLAGPRAIKPEENRPVSRRLPVRQAGPHVLWVRFLAGPYAGKFTVALRQHGATLVEKELAENDPVHGGHYQWVWDSLPVELEQGDVEMVLTRPERGASWVTRKIDLFVLTNRLGPAKGTGPICRNGPKGALHKLDLSPFPGGYVPEVEHFRPQGYLRFTNLSDAGEPYCLWIWVRRHQGPRWYANPGMLSRAGLSESYYVPRDKTKWLAPGGRSPWVRISDYLLAAGGRNNVRFTATRKRHTDGFVEGRIQGRLEFAVGPGHRVVKTVDVDQAGARILMTLPYDFQAEPDQIKTARDYVRETEAAVARLGPAKGKPAEWLNLAANLSLRAGLDDPEILDREIAILKGLGFNQTYRLIAPPDQAVEFYRKHGLLARFGGGPSLWGAVQHHSQHHPDVEAMRKRVEEFAERNRPILDRFVRFKLMDEPSGMSYESIAESEPCRQKFVQWLKAQGLTPAKLGAKTWDEVAPVLPQDSGARPELFYYTGLFRLEGFATLAKACVEAKRARLPDTMLTYVNYSPPTSGGSWTQRGTDLFLAHRRGGMEMVWTEDWLGYSLGPEHLSDTLALCRAAGRPEKGTGPICRNGPEGAAHKLDQSPFRRLGAYCVGQGTPTLMRMKYYTLVAGGARDIESYDYGPWYAGIDSWGRRFELYPAIRRCQLELGAIDPYLHGTVRRKTDVAILYNRTASIWAGKDNSCLLNGSFTHWALAHAGYDADFLAEEDVEAGALSHYKVLYLDGPQLRRPAAEAIAAWVDRGGVLFGTAGAASRDRFDRPTDVLEKTFGVRCRDFAAKAAAGRPKYELRGLKPLDRLEPAGTADAPAVRLDQLCYQERLEAKAGARAILLDGQSRPAGTLNKARGGTAIRVAALPGISYAHEAAQPPYDPDSYLPKKFRTGLRDFIAWPARLAGAARVAAAQSPIAEVVRYDGPDRAVVFVIDHAAQPVERFSLELDDAAGFTRALSAAGSPVRLTSTDGGKLRVRLPLSTADAVVLLKGDPSRAP